VPLAVPIEALDEDPNNPRTEFPESELAELAQDIAERGVLQPIVVELVDATGRYRIRFGAKRWRAAKRAGLRTVLVRLATRTHDAYDQVAENLKRHGLSAWDLARFIQQRVADGESNATIGRRLGLDQTTVANHLTLLALPPVLEGALHSGRCTSPRTLAELNRLHATDPARVTSLIEGEHPITRAAVVTIRELDAVVADAPVAAPAASHQRERPAQLLSQASTLCDRLEAALSRLRTLTLSRNLSEDAAALQRRLAALGRSLDG
jgi:ParB family chromosome partitioning protein